MLLVVALFAAVPMAQDATSPAPPRKEARSCRRVGNTGSRMDEKRICKTRSEWAAIDAANNLYGVDAKHTGEAERNRANR